MRQLGEIVHLQVQTAPLKYGPWGHKSYHPEHIRRVDRVSLSSRGVLGRDGAEAVADVHHQDHVLRKNKHGKNGVSILFTRHYEEMQERFGDHLYPGVAGETILVRSEHRIYEGDLRTGVIVRHGDGEARLELSKIAEPCVEFSRYASCRPARLKTDAAVREALDFLRGGTRGYYLAYAGPEMEIALGDVVYVP
ncbi:MAG: MOSC domain-containing protein [Chloroflexota bacterium]